MVAQHVAQHDAGGAGESVAERIPRVADGRPGDVLRLEGRLVRLEGELARVGGSEGDRIENLRDRDRLADAGGPGRVALGRE